MKELTIIVLLVCLSMLSASAVHTLRQQIVKYEYKAYIQRVSEGRGFSGWH